MVKMRAILLYFFSILIYNPYENASHASTLNPDEIEEPTGRLFPRLGEGIGFRTTSTTTQSPNDMEEHTASHASSLYPEEIEEPTESLFPRLGEGIPFRTRPTTTRSPNGMEVRTERSIPSLGDSSRFRTSHASSLYPDDMGGHTVVRGSGLLQQYGSAFRWNNYLNISTTKRYSNKVNEIVSLMRRKIQHDDFRLVFVDFTFFRFEKRESDSFAVFQLVLKTDRLKRIYSHTFDNSSKTQLARWLNRFIRDADSSMKMVVYIDSILHTGTTGERNIGWRGQVKKHGLFVPWHEDYQDYRSTKYIEMDSVITTSVRNILQRSRLYPALIAVEMLSCDWTWHLGFTLNLWRTTCQVVMAFDEDRLLEIDHELLKKNSLALFESELQNLMPHMGESGYTTMQITELRSPIHSGFLMCKMGAYLMRDGVRLEWDEIYREPTQLNDQSIRSLAVQTMNTLINEAALNGTYHVLNIRLVESNRQVYGFVTLSVRIYELKRIFNYGYEETCDDILQRINTGLARIDNPAFETLQHSY